MSELLNNPMLIFWGAITLMCIVPVIAGAWYKIRKAELEAGLKREMIERGMSADEICRVLHASPTHQIDETDEKHKERAT
jgi:hypothetical protein